MAVVWAASSRQGLERAAAAEQRAAMAETHAAVAEAQAAAAAASEAEACAERTAAEERVAAAEAQTTAAAAAAARANAEIVRLRSLLKGICENPEQLVRYMVPNMAPTATVQMESAALLPEPDMETLQPATELVHCMPGLGFLAGTPLVVEEQFDVGRGPAAAHRSFVEWAMEPPQFERLHGEVIVIRRPKNLPGS
jgi:hypothetical protein